MTKGAKSNNISTPRALINLSLGQKFINKRISNKNVDKNEYLNLITNHNKSLAQKYLKMYKLSSISYKSIKRWQNKTYDYRKSSSNSSHSKNNNGKRNYNSNRNNKNQEVIDQTQKMISIDCSSTIPERQNNEIVKSKAFMISIDKYYDFERL